MISLVIPVYNEKTSLEELLRRVVAVDMPKELVVVDDCSTDGSREILAGAGRARARRSARARARRTRTGCRSSSRRRTRARARRCAAASPRRPATVVIVQDADLEYDPREIPRLVAADRRRRTPTSSSAPASSATPRRVLYYWHAVVNRLLTTLSNMTIGPEPHRHGDLLQGLPPRGHPVHRHRGGPLRLRAGDHRQGRPRPAPASTRCPSATTGAPTRKARRSAGRTASAPSTPSPSTR